MRVPCSTYTSPYQTEAYWKDQLDNSTTDSFLAQTLNPSQDKQIMLSDFDRHRQSLLDQKGGSTTMDTCGAEVRRYLKEVEEDVTKDTDIVKWWQDHARIYPTLSRIALDVLPCQASSVPSLISLSKS
ncbi:hypothetical protein AX14_006784 [Amanita brunnescens Koide BX004]|nr:hypothetical protein AX14_006784 [Amanita brunnescens Koide BX004]